MITKAAMFLKILCIAAFLVACCSSERYSYHTVNGGRSLLSSGPLELYLLPADESDTSAAAHNVDRQRRSLTSTEEPYAHIEGVDNPHQLSPGSVSSTAGGLPPTPSIIPGLSSNPTLADKSPAPRERTYSFGERSKAAQEAAGQLKPGKVLKKVLPSAGDEAKLSKGGVALNTPISSVPNSNAHPSDPAPPSISTSPPAAAAQPINSNSAHASSSPSSNSSAASGGSAAASPSSPSVAPHPSNGAGDDLDDFSADITNKMLNEHNITSTTNDTHHYYQSSVSREEARAKALWIELNDTNSQMNDILSNAHRRAVTHPLAFDFPFYGHPVHNVTITTGGFLYTGEQTHPWLAATQYIAPLMANFDTSVALDSYIRFFNNETQFTVTWENVRLQDKPEAGGFTFQATLYKSGNIAFVYKSIPVVAIDDDHHPVKVGLSDSYVMDKTIFFVRRKTIYEYHRVQFSHTDISNWTSIYLTALPTCLDHKDCEACLSDPTSQFKCSWCPTANRCSTGLDRNRQDWVQKGCDRVTITGASLCASAAAYAPHMMSGDEHMKSASAEQKADNSRTTISSLLFTLISIACFVGVVVWAVYAYNNPMSSSGQILIRYRPSQWTMKRGEARYTAATIHM
uniref:Plexin domain-containing protein 2 n=2 Tax=Cacopsylla melanoneura TaxID=428564 RepID=A0A8D8WLC2_9HEMI